MKYHYIIVGASIAGVSAIKSIRSIDTESTILLISAEDRLPYKRTKLSKKIAGPFDTNEFLLLNQDDFNTLDIELQLNTSATHLDTKNKQVITTEGLTFTYEKLLIASGAIPSPCFSIDSDEVLFLRNAKDTEILRKKADAAKTIAVVGGGVEGLEMADQFINLGKEVHLFHSGDKLMNRHVDGQFSNYLETLFIERGVNLHLGERVEQVTTLDGRTIIKTNKDELACDLAVASTGIMPDLQLIEETEIECTKNGVLVSEHCATSVKDIYAAGDVIQLKSLANPGLWHFAEYSGQIAGLNMAGKKQKFENVPYRLKCEVFGEYIFSINYKNVSVEPGLDILSVTTETGGRFTFFCQGSELQGALMLNHKEHAKELEKAVRQGMDYRVFLDSLGTATA